MIRYTCEQCKDEFTLAANLRTHKINICDEKPFRCHRCKHRFPTVAMYQDHFEWHYEQDRITLGLDRDVRTYSCLFCAQLFAKAELGIAHMLAEHLSGNVVKSEIKSESDNGIVSEEPIVPLSSLSSAMSLPQPTSSSSSTVRNTIVAKSSNNNDDDGDDDELVSEPREPSPPRSSMSSAMSRPRPPPTMMTEDNTIVISSDDEDDDGIVSEHNY